MRTVIISSPVCPQGRRQDTRPSTGRQTRGWRDALHAAGHTGWPRGSPHLALAGVPGGQVLRLHLGGRRVAAGRSASSFMERSRWSWGDGGGAEASSNPRSGGKLRPGAVSQPQSGPDSPKKACGVQFSFTAPASWVRLRIKWVNLSFYSAWHIVSAWCLLPLFFIGLPLYAGPCAGCWGHSGGQDPILPSQESHCPAGERQTARQLEGRVLRELMGDTQARGSLEEAHLGWSGKASCRRYLSRTSLPGYWEQEEGVPGRGNSIRRCPEVEVEERSWDFILRALGSHRRV